MQNANKEAYHISGDFNVDLTKYENDSMIKNYIDMILSLGCIPLGHRPTRITMNSSTLLHHMHIIRCKIISATTFCCMILVTTYQWP